ncbi:MAG: DsbA family protein [Chloroflexi bacterium]|nr:DsbA family protein [Chloroflexota bacterium]
MILLDYTVWTGIIRAMSLPSEETPPEEETLTFRVRRSQLLTIAIPVAFLVGLAIGYVAWGGSDTSPAAQVASSQNELASAQSTAVAEPTGQAQTIADQIEALERYELDINETDPVFGPEDAPITIIEFSDFECPFCKSYFLNTYPRLLADYADQIRFVYKDFPLTSIHPDAVPAAMAAQCAFEQDEFWAYHDLLFDGELGLTRSSFEAYAGQLPLDQEEFAACLDEDRYVLAVKADADYGAEIGVRSTPTFFINGIGVVGAQPYEVFSQIIDFELERLNAAQ